MLRPEQLKTRIEEELWEDDGLDARHIRVVVNGQDVWLEGEVPTPAMYDLAERIVGQIGGVGDLTNSLTCTEEPYDIATHRDGEDLRAEPTTDVTPAGRLEARIGPFGEEWDEATPLEGVEAGGPVGGDSGENIHPMDFNEIAPLATENMQAEEPWRYQTDGPNAHLEPEPVLPPDEDEV
ncbi:MAG: BON domain-containing protein [Armatimonadota bacterium]